MHVNTWTHNSEYLHSSGLYLPLLSPACEGFMSSSFSQLSWVSWMLTLRLTEHDFPSVVPLRNHQAMGWSYTSFSFPPPTRVFALILKQDGRWWGLEKHDSNGKIEKGGGHKQKGSSSLIKKTSQGILIVLSQGCIWNLCSWWWRGRGCHNNWPWVQTTWAEEWEENDS